MEQVGDAPVKEDINEHEQCIGDGDGKEIGNTAAQSHKLHTNCRGRVAEGDKAYKTEPRSAAVNQEQVQAETGEDGGRDVDGAEVCHKLILPLFLWITWNSAYR